MQVQNTINDLIKASISVKEQIISDGVMAPILEEVIQIITKTFQNGGAVYFCGNGGSGSTSNIDLQICVIYGHNFSNLI